MRFGFVPSETESEERSILAPSTSKEEQLEWVLLQKHPVFSAPTTAGRNSGIGGGNATLPSTSSVLSNLIAWDGASRLYLWDSNNCCLHRLSIRLGDPEPTSIVAASSSKVLQPDIQELFVVNNISINRNGSAMLLEGSDGLRIMYLYGRNSTKDNTIICRTVKLGSGIYFDSNSVRTLQVLWHPYSDTHLGIISSDSVFRLFDLSSSLERPEQEYYLQPVVPGRCYNAASICPAGFSFGGEHLWERFSVFVLFTDGSVYILCPVVPFGSVYRWESMAEIYNDAHAFGLKSSNLRAVSNSSIAIAWLEATFPELGQQDMEGGKISALKAHPYPQFDASLSLQGPLCKLCQGGEEDDSEGQGANCEGRAVGFLYNSVSKDSILVTAWSSGQLQIYALADEIQPAWNVGSRPRFCVDSHDHICGLAMICDSNQDEPSVVKLNQPLDDTLWLGYPPPLLRLAVVDLALPKIADNGSLLKMFVDPLIPERIYCLHGGGVDSIVLNFLPFTSQTSGKDETMRAPSVHPVLSTCRGESCSPPLCGLVALADPFGYSWILGVTFSQECILVEMKSWDVLLLQIDVDKKPGSSEELSEIDTPDIISKELLSGPKVDIIPQVSPNLRSMAADSIEGRSTLNQYFKLFNENYVEYAHKVFFELKHHPAHLKKIIDDQHARLTEAKQKLLKVEEKQLSLEDRINYAIQVHENLEERLQGLKDLPVVRKKPLSRAERQFKSELDRFTGMELDALRSSIEALNARLRRYSQSPQGNASNSERRQLALRRKPHLPDAHISHLRSSIAKLSLINDENSKKVKLVESALISHETTNG